MLSDKPNVLLLTADALRADRLSVYGYERPTSPNLERLAEKSVVCDNALTLGPFTQIACIQLFTSSRPFSHGGYDLGAEGRPETLFQRFQGVGYETWGMSTIHWVSPYYGYTDGLDEEVSVFHLNTLVGMAVVNMRDTLNVYRQGRILPEAALDRITPVVLKLFDNVEHYSNRLQARIPSYTADFPDAKIANDGYDFEKIRAVVKRHRAEFEKDPLQYTHRHLSYPPDAHEWLARDWYYARTPGKLLGEGLNRVSNRLLRIVWPRRAHQRASQVRFAVDAHAIADKVIGRIKDHRGEKPFFLWAHFKDNHTPYVSGPGRRWYEHTPDYLEDLGYPRDLDATLSFRMRYAKTDEDRETLSALYDAAARSMDEAIGKILNALDQLGLSDNTIVAFAGDHGEEIGEHGDYGHECMGYEHNVRVPMIFKAAGNGGCERLSSLVSSLDWAPTIAGLAGIDPADGWQGAPVTSREVSSRDHIVLENFCRGDCLFDHRPLYMGVRTKRYKYLWKEYVDPYHKRGSPDPELYDLEADPGEQNNLYTPGHPLRETFDLLIAERLARIPEISSERIIAAFDDRGREAVTGFRKKAVTA